MGTSVDCCAILDSLMAGDEGNAEPLFPVKNLRLAIPIGYLFDDLDDHVANCFTAAIEALSAAGAIIKEMQIAPIEAMRPSIEAGDVDAVGITLHLYKRASHECLPDCEPGSLPLAVHQQHLGLTLHGADHGDPPVWRRRGTRRIWR